VTVPTKKGKTRNKTQKTYIKGERGKRISGSRKEKIKKKRKEINTYSKCESRLEEETLAIVTIPSPKRKIVGKKRE